MRKYRITTNFLQKIEHSMVGPQYLQREVKKHSGIMHWLETQRAPSTLSKSIDAAHPSCSSKNEAHKEKQDSMAASQINKNSNRTNTYKSPNEEVPADESAQSTKPRAQTCMIVTKNEYFESASSDDTSEPKQSNISQTEKPKSDDRSDLSNYIKFSNNYSTDTDTSLICFSDVNGVQAKYESEENNYRIKPKIKYRSRLKKKICMVSCYTKNMLKTISDDSSDSVDTRTYILQNRTKSKRSMTHKRKPLNQAKFEIPKSNELFKHTHKKKKSCKTLSQSDDTDSTQHKNVPEHDISADLFNNVNDFAINKLQIRNAFVSSQRIEACNEHFSSTHDNQASEEIDKKLIGIKNKQNFYDSSSNVSRDIPKNLMKDKEIVLKMEKEDISDGNDGFCDCLLRQWNCLDCNRIYNMHELYCNDKKKLDYFDSSLHQNYIIKDTRICENQAEGKVRCSKDGLINIDCINKKEKIHLISEIYFTDILKDMPDITSVTYHGILENLTITINASGKRRITLGPPLDDDKYFSKDDANVDDQEDMYDDDISIVCFLNDENCVTFLKDGVSFSTLQEILNERILNMQ